MSEPITGTTDELLINMGPQHPSTHGVLRVALRLDGEKVLGADPDIGFLHSSMEKIAEFLDYRQYVSYSDRFDYLNAMGNEYCYVRAVERLAGIEVTPRCEYLRVAIAELQRICSHLLYFGAVALDTGATTPFLHTFRERELIYDLFEWISGQRLLYHFFRIGGMRNDLPEGWLESCFKVLDLLPSRFEEYDELLSRNRIFVGRMKDVGRISAEDALQYGLTGPCLRACGIAHDLRKLDGYGAYPDFDFDICVEHGGDCMDRHNVRIREMRESAKIARQALEELPEGEVNVAVPRKLKLEGEVYERIESPRGEVGCYIVADGSDKPWRMHWRGPSFYNLSALDLMSKDAWMADMVAIIASTDIILADVDR